MPDQKLQERVAVEIGGYRRSLLDLALRAEGSVVDARDEVLVTQILVGCRHILDRAMNAAWSAHNERRSGRDKARVYFPCRQSAEGFDQELAKSQLSILKAKNEAAYQAIRSRQPFAGMQNSWLTELFDLTQHKHESYVELESTRGGEMRIGEGQAGRLYGLVVMGDGRVFADAEMVDPRTGKPAPLRLRFVDRFNHVLRATGRDPVSYCRQCLDQVEETFSAIVNRLP